jgi:hypothetical protein
MWIMIAGPYRSGTPSEAERQRNLVAMNRAAYDVFRKGHTPIIGVNLALPIIQAVDVDRYDEVMMPLSLALADRCDAVLRLEGASMGADEEVARVRGRGGAVYRSIDEIPDGP